MRTLPLAAALVVMLLLPTALAAKGSSVELTGPSTVVSEGPTSATVDIKLTLDGVVCPGGAEIVVHLRIAETRGLRSSSLTWDRIQFRIAGHEATTQVWSHGAEVGVRLWARDPTGYVDVVAQYALPPNCTSAGGETRGEDRIRLNVQGPQPEATTRAAAAPVPKSETVLPPPGLQESAAPSPALPVPVIGAIVGMFAGGAVVFAKRMRAKP